MNEYTPGPWKNLNNEAIISVENGRAVAFPSGQQAEQAANAYLITAAPDLLAACEAALAGSTETEARYGYHVVSIEAMNQLRAALAKVRGET